MQSHAQFHRDYVYPAARAPPSLPSPREGGRVGRRRRARGWRANYPRGLIHRPDSRRLAAASRESCNDDRARCSTLKLAEIIRRVSVDVIGRRFSVHVDPASGRLPAIDDSLIDRNRERALRVPRREECRARMHLCLSGWLSREYLLRIDRRFREPKSESRATRRDRGKFS